MYAFMYNYNMAVCFSISIYRSGRRLVDTRLIDSFAYIRLKTTGPDFHKLYISTNTRQKIRLFAIYM
jgi:hypothetical protein